MLVRLLYASRLISPQREKVIEDILNKSRQNNPGLGITGLLVYSEGVFLQALEGGRAQVSELYNLITSDERHSDVVLLHFQEITQRRFGGWSMGQVNMAKVNASVMLKYSAKAELDPFSVSGEVSLALLEELMASASVMGRV